MRSPTPLLLVLTLLAACQEPFGADRHDLVGDRIVAITARAAAGDHWLVAQPALLVDGRPWADDAVDLAWYWIPSDDPDDVAVLDGTQPPDAVGPVALLPRPAGGGDPARLALAATFPSGTLKHAVLDVVGERPEPPALDHLVADPEVPPDEATFVSAWFEPLPDTLPMMRWMSVAGRGTWSELTRDSAQWVAAEITTDDGEEVERDPLDAGPVTLVGLAIDSEGGNAIAATELFVGAAPTGVYSRSGRWLSTDSPQAGPWVTGFLEADDDAPTGVRMVGASSVVSDPNVPPLACGDGGAFDPDWLLRGRCLRDDVIGTRVVMELQ